MISAPLRVFTRLHTLTLFAPYDLDGLLLPLHHMNSLEALSLHAIDDLDNLRLFLSGSAKLVPRLTSFSLGSEEHLHDEDFMAICNFLIDRPAFKRLSLDFKSDWSDISLLMPAIDKMKALEALALALNPRDIQDGDDFYEPIHSSDIEPFLRALPSSLEALVLDTRLDTYEPLVSPVCFHPLRLSNRSCF